MLTLAFLLLCASGWLFALGVMVLALTHGGMAQRIVYGVVPLALSGAIVVRQCRRGWLRCSALLLAACAADVALYLAQRGEPDAGLRIDWDEARGVLSWGPASVRFPDGFRYQKEDGIDTQIGRIASADGSIVIRHDIGGLAGEHAGAGGVESLRDGSRVRISPGGVAFPDSGCAIFYLEADSADGRAIVNSLAQSFRPSNPNRLLPLLPELLRSDCRPRFRIPFE